MLPISTIVDVNVESSILTASSTVFDVGMILVPKSKYEGESRTTSVSSYAEAVTAGFTDDKVLGAVSAYFAQSPSPSSLVIGYWDDGGNETVVTGFQACRAANTDWYAFTTVNETLLSSSDIASLAEVVETYKHTVFVYAVNEPNCLIADGAAVTNTMKTLKNKSYRRTIGFYIPQNTLYSFTSSVLGRISGLNSTDANSAFALAYKNLTSVEPADLSTDQFKNLDSYNGNAYVNVSDRYYFIMYGKMASGIRYDEVFAIDVASTLIEQNVIDYLATAKYVPQTNGGVTSLITKISDACNTVRNIGFIAPGIWKGADIKSLVYGDALSSGYVILADTIAEQSQADRENRIAPTIYVCLKLAGSIEHVVVNVIVNR